MFSRLFGQFLLEEGYITASALSSALGRLGEVRPLLGMLALAHGYMTPEQVVEINEAQKKMDKRFGELAIDKGYLSVEQLESILSAQKSEHVLLGQILIDDGILSHEGFLMVLEKYRKNAGLTEDGYEAVKSNDVEGVIASVLVGQPGAGKSVVRSWGNVFMRSVIRFIDPGAAIDPLAEEGYRGLRTFAQRMHGDHSLTVFIAAEDEVFLDLAQRFAKFDIPSFDDMAEAATGEFLNLVNGLFTVNCSDEGIELDMLPQEALADASSLFKERPDALLPLLLPKGIMWTGIHLESSWSSR